MDAANLAGAGVRSGAALWAQNQANLQRVQDDLTTTLAEPKRALVPTLGAERLIALPQRLWRGLRQPHNWLQLFRFSVVGASGYAVNLGVLAFCVHVAGIEYHVGAALAWIVAGINNFVLNRHWTFKARAGAVHLQAVRFLVVSLVALGINEGALTAFVELAGLGALSAQLPALAISTPFNFLGNKLWSFRAPALYSGSAPAKEV